MIASLRGTVLTVGLDHAVIDIGGIGLAVRAAPATLAELRRGEQTTLATTLVVREESLTLYGFATAEAKELFELVQSVSGVGPKIALALLSVFDPEELRRALASGDTATLTRAPGIGRKSAERLVLELGDKVGPVSVAGPAGAVVAGATADRLVEALTGLGFTAKQAADAVGAVLADESDTSPAEMGVLLRRALSLLGTSR